MSLDTALLTARSGLSDTVQGLDSGANDYLAKPLDFGELREKIFSARKCP